MSGHLFVVEGDLAKIACDAWLLPTDVAVKVEASWKTDEQLRAAIDLAANELRTDQEWIAGRRLSYRVGGLSATLPVPYLTNIAAHPTDRGEDWFVPATMAFLKKALAEARNSRYYRARPLFGLPVVGTRRGGGKEFKGSIIRRLVQELLDWTQNNHADIALVAYGRRTFSAVQAARRDLKHDPTPLSAELEGEIERLADLIRNDQLVLFAGAGVSRGANLPMWDELLDRLAGVAKFDRQESDALGQLGELDRARVIEQRLGSDRLLQQEIVKIYRADQYSLAHGLLASLDLSEMVTVNYDTLLEEALRATGRTLSVLPHAPNPLAKRWLLKLHGCITKPDDIVLTGDHYLGFKDRRSALMGIVQALLITRHMLFVGFSLKDEHFQSIVYDVKKAMRGVSDQASNRKMGTALLLAPSLMDQVWEPDIHCLPVAERASQEAARLLEIVLDRLAFLTTTSAPYLLDETFSELLDDEERELRGSLFHVQKRMREDSKSYAAQAVTDILRKLGAKGDQESVREIY